MPLGLGVVRGGERARSSFAEVPWCPGVTQGKGDDVAAPAVKLLVCPARCTATGQGWSLSKV